MCRICTNAKAAGSPFGLEMIAKAILKGRKAEHFDKVLDELLGTVMGERDEELEAAWENQDKAKP